MSELWDVYDENRNKTGKIVKREDHFLDKGEYHLVVTGVIINSENKILICKRAKYKKFGSMWECSGGSVLAGETSLQGILRELKEELGIEFTPQEAILLKELKRDNMTFSSFKDLWLFRKDINIEDIKFPDKEATEAKWVTIDEFMDMFNNKKIVPTVNFGREEYKKAISLSMNKILAFIVNENKELLLLKGKSNDPQFHKSFWYVVTGGCEKIDKSFEDTVKREVKEETNLDVTKSIYLNWIFRYKSLGKECTEYAFISFVKKNDIILNEENIDYKWCKLEDFVKEIYWFGDKNELIDVLKVGLEKNTYLKKEKIERF